MRKIKAYMAFNRKNGPESGAMLVFHYTAREAKIIAWPAVQECICEEFIDLGVRLIDDAPWLFEEIEKDEPHVIESPKSCNICGRWGHAVIYDDGICGNCHYEINGGDYEQD